MKKKRMTRALSLLAALLMLILTACGESAENTDAKSDGGTPAAQTPAEQAPAEEETEPDLYADLPTADYGGADFPLLQYEETAAATSTICVEEMNGESVNDAIFSARSM
ncbi:MAG: hypothetical protein IKQ92_14550 [Clostridia bacterium]|nr:hypothetical protein [Clostridia bacterium]